MGWLDRIPLPLPSTNTNTNTHPPKIPNLYIGGLAALYQTDLLLRANITHILSVIDHDFHAIPSSSTHLKSQNITAHLVIPLEDDPNENLLQHFPRICEFVDSGLRQPNSSAETDPPRGGVFIHCAMGKSRSATAAAAYIMWKYGEGVEGALARVCEGRPVCEPNAGFMEQLGVWEGMLRVEGERERSRVYEAWEGGRFRGGVVEWEKRRGRGKL